MLSKLFSKKDGDDEDDKSSQSTPPSDPPARPPATATPPAETPPNVQGGILRPPQKTEGSIAVGRQKRITQRITIAITPPPPGAARGGLKISLPSAKPAPASMPAMPPVSGDVELPLSVIIPCLPEASLKEPAAKLLEGEMATKTATIPLGTILGMLPLGKIEFTLKELATYLPAAGIFKATDEFSDEICSLPISEIVKLVPPELLARRSDQKPIDEKVKKMADPFAPEASVSEVAEIAAPPIPMSVPVPEPIAAEVPLPAPSPAVEAPSPLAEAIAAEIPPLDLPVAPATESAMPDLAALAQQAAGATEPIGAAATPQKISEPTAPVIEDFALPPELAALPTVAAPEKPAETQKIDFSKTDAFKSLVEEEPIKTPAPATIEPSAPMPPIPELPKEPEAPAPAPAFSFAPEKPAAPEPAPIPAPIPSPSSFDAEQKIPAGFESFSKVVDKLSPKEEPKIETPAVETTLKAEAKPTSSLSTKVNLNQCTSDDLVRQASCPENLARKIIAWRELHGSFSDLHFLWNIPGMTTEVYRLLTGLPDEESAVELNDIFGLPSDAHLTVKDVATRIRSWPFMNGCIISGMEGLPIAFDCDDKKFAKAICAFAPKLLQQAHDVLEEINEPEAHEVHLMQEDKTISIFRYEHLILITINRRRGLSSRDAELLRQVVVKLSNVKGAKLEV